MGFYLKTDVEVVRPEDTIGENKECCNSVLCHATIISLLKSYIKCGIKRKAFTTPEAAMEFIKPLCDMALNNGDIDASDFDRIKAWMTEHHNELMNTERREDRFLKSVLMEEAAAVANKCEDAASCSNDFAQAAAVRKQCKTTFEAMKEKYGTEVIRCAQSFMDKYGKTLNCDFEQNIRYE